MIQCGLHCSYEGGRDWMLRLKVLALYLEFSDTSTQGMFKHFIMASQG